MRGLRTRFRHAPSCDTERPVAALSAFPEPPLRPVRVFRSLVATYPIVSAGTRERQSLFDRHRTGRQLTAFHRFEPVFLLKNGPVSGAGT